MDTSKLQERQKAEASALKALQAAERKIMTVALGLPHDKALEVLRRVAADLETAEEAASRFTQGA